MAYNGLKLGTFHLFWHPKCPGIIFGKCIVHYFLSHKGPFSRHFGIFGMPKHATTGSKHAKKTCLCIPRGLGLFLKKVFFSFCTQWAFLACFGSHLFGLLLAACRSPVGQKTGALRGLSNSEGWKPAKVGGCGWIRCPQNHILSHTAQDIPVLGLKPSTANVHKFLGVWGPLGVFLGHIVVGRLLPAEETPRCKYLLLLGGAYMGVKGRPYFISGAAMIRQMESLAAQCIAIWQRHLLRPFHAALMADFLSGCYPVPPAGGGPLLPYQRVPRAPRCVRVPTPSSLPSTTTADARPARRGLGKGRGSIGGFCPLHGVSSCSRCRATGQGVANCCRYAHVGRPQVGDSPGSMYHGRDIAD